MLSIGKPDPRTCEWIRRRLDDISDIEDEHTPISGPTHPSQDNETDLELFLDAYAPVKPTTGVRNMNRLPAWIESDSEDELPAWDAVAEPLDYRTVSTPDTTWVLITAFDMSYPTIYPEYDVAAMQKAFKGMSDHIVTLTGTQVTKGAVLEQFDVLKEKHACVWYEFAHGGEGRIVTYNGQAHTGTPLYNTEVLDFITSAKGRVFCMFSSCNSGSMTDFTGSEELSGTQPTLKAAKLQSVAPAQPVEQEEAQTIVQWLKERLERRAGLLAASPAAKQPMIMMWAGTASGHDTFYCVGADSVFGSAIEYAYNTRDKSPRWKDAWEVVKRNAKQNTNLPETERKYCVPECYQYGIKHDDIMAWT